MIVNSVTVSRCLSLSKYPQKYSKNPVTQLERIANVRLLGVCSINSISTCRAIQFRFVFSMFPAPSIRFFGLQDGLLLSTSVWPRGKCPWTRLPGRRLHLLNKSTCNNYQLKSTTNPKTTSHPSCRLSLAILQSHEYTFNLPSCPLPLPSRSHQFIYISNPQVHYMFGPVVVICNACSVHLWPENTSL